MEQVPLRNGSMQAVLAVSAGDGLQRGGVNPRKHTTEAMAAAINLCLQQLKLQENLLQQPLVDQVQLYQIIHQQHSIYDTISSTAKAIREHLLQQKLLHLPHLQKQKSRRRFLREADKIGTKSLKLNQEKLNCFQELMKILENHTLHFPELLNLGQTMRICTQNNISFGEDLKTQLQHMPETASQLQTHFQLLETMRTPTTPNPVAMKSPTRPFLGDTSDVPLPQSLPLPTPVLKLQGAVKIPEAPANDLDVSSVSLPVQQPVLVRETMSRMVTATSRPGQDKICTQHFTPDQLETVVTSDKDGNISTNIVPRNDDEDMLTVPRQPTNERNDEVSGPTQTVKEHENKEDENQ